MNNFSAANQASIKKNAKNAVIAIILFVIAYLSLLLLAIAFAAVCVGTGIWLVKLYPAWATIAICATLSIMGIIVFFFMIKFMFKEHISDVSNMIELNEIDAPELYAMIGSIVKQVKTKFPKKIYLSYDVNAVVFYNSTFWSMFLPVRKNLIIGMGLINTTTKLELKAILSHEFGHFSQRSMKIGSYVYTANQIIYDLLFNNDKFGNFLDGFDHLGNFMRAAKEGGIAIIRGLQNILARLYRFLNVKHLSLSRAMEFQADEVALQITGKTPFINSLLRIDLSRNALNEVIQHYETQINGNVKPVNIYLQHALIVNEMAKDSGHEMVNGLPVVSLDDINIFDRSKLNTDDRWSSHPSLNDRVNAAQQLFVHEETDNGEPAASLFNNIHALQELMTNVLFHNGLYKYGFKTESVHEFENGYLLNRIAYTFPAIFNKYYDFTNPITTKLSERIPVIENDPLTFFSDEKREELLIRNGLINDINALDQIYEDQSMKSFRYDNKDYKLKDFLELRGLLEDKLNVQIDIIKQHNNMIFNYFQLHGSENLKSQMKYYDDFCDLYDEKYLELYNRIINTSSFIYTTTPFKQIEEKLEAMLPLEAEFKQMLERILNDAQFESVITPKHREVFKGYMFKDWVYFEGKSYDDVALNVFQNAIVNYLNLIQNAYENEKSKLLKTIELDLNSIEIQAIA